MLLGGVEERLVVAGRRVRPPASGPRTVLRRDLVLSNTGVPPAMSRHLVLRRAIPDSAVYCP